MSRARGPEKGDSGGSQGAGKHVGGESGEARGRAGQQGGRITESGGRIATADGSWAEKARGGLSEI